jgi:hypothetical protein
MNAKYEWTLYKDIFKQPTVVTYGPQPTMRLFFHYSLRWMTPMDSQLIGVSSI